MAPLLLWNNCFWLFFYTIMVSSVVSAYSRTIMTRFVLIETHHKGNVGAAARALKTMGFDALVLLSPRDSKVLSRQRTKEAASGALDVLAKTQIVESLDQALEGMTHVCATAMPHSMSLTRPEYDTFQAPRVYFENILQNDRDVRIAFLFGNERVGMREKHVLQCDALLGIPTNPVSVSCVYSSCGLLYIALNVKYLL
jgi:tRNA/rRNA methyltransferase